MILRAIDNIGAWACFFVASWAAYHAWGYVPVFWMSIGFMVLVPFIATVGSEKK